MHPSLRRLLGALALVAAGFALGALFRPAAPPLPAAFAEAGPVRANGSASVTCLTVGDARHMAAVADAEGRLLSPAYPQGEGMHASFSSARKGALLLHVATVTVYDVRGLRDDFELTCVAVVGGYNSATAAARPRSEWLRQLERLRRAEL
ncbi:ORF134 hypothetical protein [Orf virus]|uniref:Uncharacterized protein n=1 Tax=Orf virus (strain Goat/Texas/SA00/2000) TaxID=647330 RepID=Q6TVI7_ORFSA|nr:ORF001 hypothetical protein [Orf virus]NP_957910.1 ORF134 hypothetical protein [Orf virus]AAR98229.1 ORF001 hypothetical protein [Orf virus]AAR98358.1 ORF134 hypothetical protein [Orf virus]